MTEVRKDGTLDYLRPDGKTQVTVEYENDRPKRVDTIVISTQHSDTVSLDTIREDLKKHVIDVIAEILDIANEISNENTKFNYLTTRSSLMKFMGADSLNINEVTLKFLNDYTFCNIKECPQPRSVIIYPTLRHPLTG